ncbi:MAG: GAF domain-containing protein [Desulfobacteraceae bacterium]|nr:GAF domain-containing protein [Desulfobacteraceae bacterium]
MRKYPEIIRETIQSSEVRILHKNTAEDRFLFSELHKKTGCYMNCNSFCSLPLTVNQQTIGAMNIHSGEKEAFLSQELDLLQEVAADISFAITAIHERQQRRQAEKSLREHETQLMMIQKMEAVGVLAAGIAHDFNNILQPMLGYAEISMDDAPKDSMLEKNMKEILTAGRRAKELVQRILIFGKKSEQTLEPVYISTILKEALKFMRASLPSTIEIRYKLNKESKPILGNATQIYQIFINLFTNAYHAMENTGGILEVRMSDIRIGDQNMIHLTISDTGKGIEEHIRERIFEPYFTTKEEGKGTGLGLSIVYGIIMNHDGQIDFESAPGKGTIFTIFSAVYRYFRASACCQHIGLAIER